MLVLCINPHLFGVLKQCTKDLNKAVFCFSMGVEFICEGGFGSEAEVSVELRTEFPGIGGNISTLQSIATALRTEFNTNSGHNRFFLHTIIKKLEDYFFKKGVYNYSHVPRPLGSTEKAYIYEWAFGTEGLPWYYQDKDYNQCPVMLKEWNEFVGAFNSVGIDLSIDCTDADDGRFSKNIIYQMSMRSFEPVLSPLWKRIDFGPKSVRIKYDILWKFLKDNETDLRKCLRCERYELLLLATKYCMQGSLDKEELGMLRVHTANYRLSTLRHLVAWNSGSEATELADFSSGK